jgi:DtxR family transcriptional regulator, Mn-dependent transcriptional regulator
MAESPGRREQTASMEDYLEAIANLGRGGKAVRVKQISDRVGVKMPSVTSALKKLCQQELVEHERYGRIRLTASGQRVAHDVIHRHEALTRFFCQALGIDQQTAEEDACRIEHVISATGVERLAKFVEFMEACPLGGAGFPDKYEYYLEHGTLPEGCLKRGGGKRRGQG